MAQLIQIAPLDEAMKKFGAKSAVASTLTSAEWSGVPLALRDRAFFSSQVENARFLSLAQQKIRDALALRREDVKNGTALVSRDSFIGDLRALVLGSDRSGLPVSANPFADRGLTSVASPQRLAMIFDMQSRSAQGFSDWKLGQDADVLDAFPAQELLPSTARTPRGDWKARWSAAGGPDLGERLVALKTDPVWAKLSRFGSPWPPFDFGSTRDLRDVSRDEAESLGLLKAGERIEPTQQQDFNRDLEASVADIGPEYLAALKTVFGDQVTIRDGKASWKAAA